MLKEYYQKLLQFTPDRVENDLFIILKSEENTAVNMITDQLSDGKDSLGENLPDYSMTSITRFGKEPGPWTLHDTGVFYRSIMLEEGFPVKFGSSDLKSGQIFDNLESKDRNWNDVIQLSEENRKDLSRSYLLEKSKDYFRKVLAV